MDRTALVSFIKQWIYLNKQKLITGDVLQNVLLTFLSNVLLATESGSNTVLQYSTDDENWDATQSAAHQYMRISSDGGSTWGQSQFLPNHLYSLILGNVSDDGNTLEKLETLISANTSQISGIMSSINSDPDLLTNLQNLVDMVEANHTTLEPLLVGKLDTSVFNEVVYGSNGLYARLYQKADRDHLHGMADISGLVTALEGKAAIGHQHTAEQLAAWGITTTADLSFGRF